MFLICRNEKVRSQMLQCFLLNGVILWVSGGCVNSSSGNDCAEINYAVMFSTVECTPIRLCLIACHPNHG